MDLSDFKHKRTDRQVDAAQLQVKTEAAACDMKSDTNMLKLYRAYGIRSGRSVFEGLTFDACAQTFRDGSLLER